MKYSFTRNDLLRRLYKETEPTEDQAIDSARGLDWSLQEEYESLEAMKELLDETPTYQPSQSSIDAILRHSRRTARKKALR